MIDITLENNICLIEPKGPLSKDDFVAIAARVDPVIESEGRLEGLIIKTRDFPGWESFSDAVSHFRFVRNHHQFIKKVAFVTDAKIADLLAPVASHFVKAEVKRFDFSEYAQAVTWISGQKG